MPTFESLTCDNCDNIVEKTTNTGKIVFICVYCHKTRASQEDDTLMASYSFQTSSVDDHQYEKTLRYASHFPINPRTFDKKCPKCKKNDNVRYLRLGNNEKKIYVCSCGKKGADTAFV